MFDPLKLVSILLNSLHSVISSCRPSALYCSRLSTHRIHFFPPALPTQIIWDQKCISVYLQRLKCLLMNNETFWGWDPSGNLNFTYIPFGPHPRKMNMVLNKYILLGSWIMTDIIYEVNQVWDFPHQCSVSYRFGSNWDFKFYTYLYFKFCSRSALCYSM